MFSNVKTFFLSVIALKYAHNLFLIVGYPWDSQVMSLLHGYLKTSSVCFQDPSSARLQDILKLLISKTCSRCVQNVFVYKSYEKVVYHFGMPWNILLELGLTLKTSRRSLQNVFISRDYFQMSQGPDLVPTGNPQDVQKRSLKHFHFLGLFPDVLGTRSCAHWEPSKRPDEVFKTFSFLGTISRRLGDQVLCPLGTLKMSRRGL